jgi:hypothetical protein
VTEKQDRYLTARIQQLTEELSKTKSDYDKSWYKRMIQELNWVIQMRDKPTKNCNIEEYLYWK